MQLFTRCHTSWANKAPQFILTQDPLPYKWSPLKPTQNAQATVPIETFSMLSNIPICCQ